ncbi:MAG: hypothetical protein ACLSFC_05820 [Enterocloster bolteae]
MEKIMTDKYQIRTKKHQDIIESIFTGTAVARPDCRDGVCKSIFPYTW